MELGKDSADGRPGTDVGCGWRPEGKARELRAVKGLPYSDTPFFFSSSRKKASMKPPCFLSTVRWAMYSTAPSAGGRAW